MGAVARHLGACAHCGLTLPALGAVEDEAGRPYCCQACALVAGAIREAGLEAYYELAEPAGAPPAVDEGLLSDAATGADAGVWPVEVGPDGRAHLRLYLEGIHCAACVWLTEKVAEQVEGVTSAQTSLASHRMQVTLEGAEPATVVQALARFGYRAVPDDETHAAQVRRRADRALLWRLAFAGALAGNLMLFAVPFYAGTVAPSEARWFRGLSLVLATLLVLGPARLFFSGAWRALQARRASVDQPLSLGIGLSYLGSTLSLLRGHEMWFDSLGALVFLLLVGRAVERFGRGRRLKRLGRLLTPKPVRRVEGDTERWVPPTALVRGDRIHVGPGEAIPVDARLEEGEAEVDLSLLTGEPLPRLVSAGETLPGGALLVRGEARLEVLRPRGASLVARLEGLVDDAISRRTPALTLADRAAGFFVVGILLLGAGTAAAWSILDPGRALQVTVAVLVVSCPCALALAVPATFAGGLARAARFGVLLRDGSALLALSEIDTVVFDKTGTLTEGRPRITDFTGDLPRDEALALAASAAAASVHPLSRALVAAADEAGLSRAPSSAFAEVAGRGVSARTEGREVRAGSAEFCWGEATEAGASGVYLGVGGRLRGRFSVVDALRPDAAEAVARLRALGLTPVLLSGDPGEAVAAIAEATGIDTFERGLCPEEKAAWIRSRGGERVLFVGDGNNDAPALAEARVGLATGGATDLARRASAGILLGTSLSILAHLLDLGRRVRSTLRRNLALALVYNAVVIPLAVTGNVGPLGAALLMPLSSLLVVASALHGTR